MTLGKDLFVDKRCVDRPLPRGTLGKGFAESKTAFAERLGLSAKPLYAVVLIEFILSCPDGEAVTCKPEDTHLIFTLLAD